MRDLSLQRRFTLLLLFILLAVALPTAGWLNRLFDEQASVRAQSNRRPAALALLQANTALQEHRLHSLLRLSGQADQEGAQAQAAAHLQSLHAAPPEQAVLRERLDTLEKTLKQLAADVSTEKLAARESFDRHGELLRQVQSGAQQVHTASQEVRADNLELSNRSEAAASRLQEAAARVNELATEVGLTSEATGRAHGMAREAAAVAEQGGAKVQAVVQTMEAIQQSSRRITDIIGVIDGIAFQTNILALNAAVEAARAGEQGRGFAVVATEVRNLAQRAASAAREIKQLISSSAERVEGGTALMHEAGLTMSHIVEAVGRVSVVIEDISAAARRQGDEIGQVDQAVRAVDQLTQRNAAMVEQSAAAAATLAEQADQLSERVARFRL
ncbi:methyl-accepting chemotaxis protein [Inhella sp.]|uniref:methyl-accepting chemotaxis protein n=1 Tax=Inhella sp. TaxID=1921806 RepID=UPI0035AF76F0